MSKTPPSLPYAQSLGAIALSDDPGGMGARLAHDQRHDQAREWAIVYFAEDAPRLSRYLCELAMHCALHRNAAGAEALFLEALDNGDPLDDSLTAILSAALAQALATLDSGLAGAVLGRLRSDERRHVTVCLAVDVQPAISLPADAGIPLAEDLVATVLLVHFSRSLESQADPMVAERDTLLRLSLKPISMRWMSTPAATPGRPSRWQSQRSPWWFSRSSACAQNGQSRPRGSTGYAARFGIA